MFASLLSVILAPAVTAEQSTPIRVPTGQELLLDGDCNVAEWRAARVIPLSNGYRIKVQKTQRYLYVCIEPVKASNFMSDLLLQRGDGTLVDLHASAKLAELKFGNGEWEKMGDNTAWWQVRGWWATTMRPTGNDESPFLPSSAIEYQIDRSQFADKSPRFMLSINFGKVMFPSGAEPKDMTSWAKLDLFD